MERKPGTSGKYALKEKKRWHLEGKRRKRRRRERGREGGREDDVRLAGTSCTKKEIAFTV